MTLPTVFSCENQRLSTGIDLLNRLKTRDLSGCAGEKGDIHWKAPVNRNDCRRRFGWSPILSQFFPEHFHANYNDSEHPKRPLSPGLSRIFPRSFLGLVPADFAAYRCPSEKQGGARWR